MTWKDMNITNGNDELRFKFPRRACALALLAQRYKLHVIFICIKSIRDRVKVYTIRCHMKYYERNKTVTMSRSRLVN